MKDITVLSVSCSHPPLSVNRFDRSSEYYLPKHSHNYWQVIVVTEGELEVVTEAHSFHLTRGMVNVLPPRCEHSLSSNGYCQIGINFEDGIEELYEIYSAFPEPVSLSVPSVLEYSRQLCSLERDMPLWLESIGALAKLMLVATAQVKLVKRRDPRERAILEYIEEHLGGGFSLNGMAETLFISVSHLERCTKRLFGKSVTALYNCKRFEYACVLLVTTDMSVSAVSDALGFDELSNFSAFFKRYASLSPLEYRKHHNEDN